MAEILYREVEKASKDIKNKFPKTRKSARKFRIAIIIFTGLITLSSISLVKESENITPFLSVILTTITAIEALLGLGKKAIQEHEYYCDVEMLRIEIEMYLASGKIEMSKTEEYLKKFASIRIQFHKNRIDTVGESFDDVKSEK